MIAGDVSDDPPWKDKTKKAQTHLSVGPLPASRAKFAPRAVQKPMAKEVYKSGFFYIEGCFYNDMRWPECIDYRYLLSQIVSQILNFISLDMLNISLSLIHI